MKPRYSAVISGRGRSRTRPSKQVWQQLRDLVLRVGFVLGRRPSVVRVDGAEYG